MVPPTLGALSLTITETVLVFAGIPGAVVLAVYAAVYGTTARRSSKRYRPGRPFSFAPVWFLASSREATAVAGTAGAHRTPEVTAGDTQPALPTGTAGAEELEPAATQYGETGGASDSW